MNTQPLNEAVTDQIYTKRELARQDAEQRDLEAAQYNASLLSDGENLTPTGEKFVAWLDQTTPTFDPVTAPQGSSNIQNIETATAVQSYVGNVLNSQTFTAAKWISVYYNLATVLWGMYQKHLKSTAAPAQESAKPSASAARMIHLRESAQLAEQLRSKQKRFIDFMHEACSVIANAPKSSTAARQAANHWREHVGRAGKPPAIYMRDNPQQTAALVAIFEAYEADGGHTPPARPLPKLATSNGVLTQLGETVAQMLQAQHRTGKLKRTPATDAFIQMTEGAGIPCGQFFAQYPRQADHLYSYSLNSIQEDINQFGAMLKAEIKALKHE